MNYFSNRARILNYHLFQIRHYWNCCACVMYLMFLILLKVFARFFFKNERRAREGGWAVPGQCWTRRTCRRHR